MRQGDRRVSLMVQPVVLAVIALVVGTAVGLLVWFVVGRTSPDDATFADLGAVVFGMVAAAIMATLIWVAGVVRLTRSLFAPGHRILVGGLALLAPVALLLLYVVLRALLTAAGGPSQELGYLALLAPVATGIAFLLADRRLPGSGPAPVHPDVTPVGARADSSAEPAAPAHASPADPATSVAGGARPTDVDAPGRSTADGGPR